MKQRLISALKTDLCTGYTGACKEKYSLINPVLNTDYRGMCFGISKEGRQLNKSRESMAKMKLDSICALKIDSVLWDFGGRKAA